MNQNTDKVEDLYVLSYNRSTLQMPWRAVELKSKVKMITFSCKSYLQLWFYVCKISVQGLFTCFCPFRYSSSLLQFRFKKVLSSQQSDTLFHTILCLSIFTQKNPIHSKCLLDINYPLKGNNISLAALRHRSTKPSNEAQNSFSVSMTCAFDEPFKQISKKNIIRQFAFQTSNVPNKNSIFKQARHVLTLSS